MRRRRRRGMGSPELVNVQHGGEAPLIVVDSDQPAHHHYRHD